MNDYSSLKTTIAEWLHRADLEPRIPDFIALADVKINQRLIPRMKEVEVVLTSTPGSEFLDLPANFDAPVALWLEAWTPRRKLTMLSIEQMEYVAVQAYPSQWTINGNQIQLNRQAPSADPYRFRYVRKYHLSDTAPSNYVLQNYPDLYLYGSLMHAAPFLRDDSRVVLWGTLFEEALKEAQSFENRSKSKAVLTTDLGVKRYNILED